MKERSGQKRYVRLGRKMGILFMASAISVWGLTGNCLGAEPAPEGEQMLEGEGVISKPSDSAGGSIFGGAQDRESETDENLESLMNSIQYALPTGNGSWAVYVSDLVNGSESSVNDHRMQAASLIKLYIMGAVYDDYETIISQYGQDNVDSCLYSMITVSDNDCANTLVSYLGGGDSSAGMRAVNEFCSEHGYSTSHMGRLLLQSNEWDDNYKSVEDCGHFLRDIYEDSQKLVHTQEMFSLLKAQTRCNKIPAQMPEGVKVANKTGELSDVENDAGIIYDSYNDLVIVFMSENLAETGSAQDTIASLSREIYNYYN